MYKILKGIINPLLVIYLLLQNVIQFSAQIAKLFLIIIKFTFFLIFLLEKINKYKSINNIGINSNTVDIYDCFDYYKKINFASGENAMYCDYCKHTCNSSMQTNLTILN